MKRIPFAAPRFFEGIPQRATVHFEKTGRGFWVVSNGARAGWRRTLRSARALASDICYDFSDLLEAYVGAARSKLVDDVLKPSQLFYWHKSYAKKIEVP